MADFLCSKCHLVLFHRRNNTQIALHPLSVVIVNVIPNHLNKFLLGSKSFAVIFLALQNTPEALHRAIVNATGYTRHALCHTGYGGSPCPDAACVSVLPSPRSVGSLFCACSACRKAMYNRLNEIHENRSIQILPGRHILRYTL